jgi:hypothetical protein
MSAGQRCDSIAAFGIALHIDSAVRRSDCDELFDHPGRAAHRSIRMTVEGGNSKTPGLGSDGIFVIEAVLPR